MIRRKRTVGCSLPYSKNTYTGKCVITSSGIVYRKLADHGCSVKAGNPCDAASGEKSLTENDYAAAHFSFTRHYSSTGFDANFISINSPGWSHNFDARIAPNQYGGFAGGLLHSGKVYGLAAAGTGAYKVANSTIELRKLANGTWLLEKDGARDIFDGTSGLLLSRELRRGFVLTLTYDADKRLTSIADPAGRTLLLDYDAHNRLARLTTPGGLETTYSYDSTGNLAAVTRPDGSVRQYHYEDSNFPHAVTGITDENGHRYATYSYDSLGRAVSTSHAGGIGLHTLTYNIDNTVVTNPLGAQTTYKFKTINGSRPVHTRTEPCTSCGSGVSVTTHAYDSMGNVTQRTDGRGIVTKYTFNTSRNLETARTEAFGTPLARTISTQWHATLRRPVQITEPGRITAFTYDADGNLLTRSVTASSQTRTWTYTYNSAGQVLTEDGPRTDVSDITTYTYDAQGNLASLSNALGHVTQVTQYDLDGRPLTLADANGVGTTLAYDLRGRLTSSTRAGAVTSFTYDNVGNVLTSTDPAGVTLTYGYDDDNRLIRITDAAGNRIEYTLNLLGGRTSEQVFDPANQLAFARSQVFDTLNRLQQVLNAGNQERQSYTYDAAGNVLSQKDGLLHGTTSTWDALGRLASSLDSAGGNTVYGYDAQDNLTSVTDAAGLVTSYAYNGFGERTSETSPNTGTTTFTRGSAGQLLTRTDARGVTTSYSHDALGRVTAITHPNSALNLSFSYDQGTHGIGRLTGMTDASGSTYYSYDSLGQLTGVQHAGLGISYLYDAAGRLTRLTYPSGHALVYARDNAGRVSSLTLEINGQTWPVASNIHWHPQGGLAALTY
ncbi:MAG: DUF6531 domain-containing protein, partial [Moraxellaceae bacterium]|nr:DUF6531 domain-containing protein [Moraxellaceae bacterium]